MSHPRSASLAEGCWFLVSCAPESWELALEDIRSIDAAARLVETYGPGMLLVKGEMDQAALAAHLRTSGPFVRHLFQVAAAVPVKHQRQDLPAIRDAARRVGDSLRRSAPTSVQARVLKPTAYRNYDVRAAVAAAFADDGFPLEVKRPAQVVSVVVTESAALIGAGPAQDNLSDWAGGARRYRHGGRISRSEFKLLEAIEVFGLTMPPGGRALDLGAAPGGWTRALRERGLLVVAVDPAHLDPVVLADDGVTHERRTAERYLAERFPGRAFDVVVNDMKMDACPSAAVMCRAAAVLVSAGMGVMTVKLHARRQRSQVSEALRRLGDAYRVVGVRKLYHNRDEVTVALNPIG